MPFKLRLFSLVLLALLPVLPLFVPLHTDPVRSFHDEWLAMMLGLLAWLLALPLLWQQQQLLIPRLALLPLVLMAFIGVQAQLLPQVVIQHTQMGMLYLLWAALLMVLVTLLVEKTNQQCVSKWIATGLSTAAVCSTGIELFFRLTGVSGWWGGTAQANHYGDLLALGFVSTLYLLAINKPIWRNYLLAAASIIVLGLSLTSSRSVWLYWIAMLVISFLIQRDIIKWILSGFGFYVLLQILWAFDLLPAIQLDITAAERFYDEVHGSNIRLHEWKFAWQLFMDSPWLGQGFGQFDWNYFEKAQHIPELKNRLEHAHNLILHLLAELGLFPVLVLLGLLGAWLKGVVCAITEKEHNALPFYTWLLMLSAILGIHSLLEYPLWYVQFLGITAFVFALGETQYWQVRLNRVFASVFSLFIMVGIAIASVHEWHYVKIEQALNNYQVKNAREVFVGYRQAAAQAPLLVPYIAIIFSISSDVGDEEMRPNLTVLNNASYHFYPSAPLVYQQAELQALNGFKDEAEHTMKLALTAYPKGAKKFSEGLATLNTVDQKKTEFLWTMVKKSNVITSQNYR